MSKKERAINLLNIKSEEQSIVLLLIGYSFCLSVGLYIYYTTATTLFLTRFEGDMLPYAYIAGGLILHLIGRVNLWIQTRINFSALVIIQLATLSASILLLIIGYQETDNKWFVFLLYLLIRANLFVFGFTFWVSASRIFDLGQAKRLYSLIGTGEVVASILANFMVKTLISQQLVKVETLLYISLGFILLSTIFIRRILIINKTSLSFRKEKDAEKIIYTKNNRYNNLMYLLGILPIACLYIIEYVFSIDSKSYFPDKNQLAIFLGQFLFICSIIELLIKVLLFRFITKTYGIISGLILIPVSLIIVSILVFVTTLFNLKIFFLVLLSRFLITSVRRSFSDTSFQLLYQPIPKKESLWLQNNIETYAKPLGYVFAGVILIVLTNLKFSNTLYIFILILLVVTIWLVIALIMKSEYRSKLLSILSSVKDSVKNKIVYTLEKSIKSETYYSEHEFNKAVILSESTLEYDRINSAKILTNSGRYQAIKYIIKLLNDKSLLVRLEVIKSISNLERIEIIPYIIPQIEHPELRESVQNSLKEIGESVVKYINNYLNKNDKSIYSTIALVEVLKEINTPNSLNVLRSKLMHPSEEIVACVLEILIELEYGPNLTEQSYFSEKIYIIINNYLWVLSAKIDLKNLLENSSLYEALIDEQNRLIKRILQILCFIHKNKQFRKIEILRLNNDASSRNYLPDLMSLLIVSEELKAKILPIFENIPDLEILLIFQNEYPQQRLSSIDRLNSIINNNNLNYWTKALALKQLLDFNNEKTKSIFAANITSENMLIKETAIYGLFKLNYDRFLNYKNYFSLNNSIHLTELFNQVESIKSVEYLSIKKAEAINSLKLYNKNESLDLESISLQSKVYSFESGENIDEKFISYNIGLAFIITVGSIEIHYIDNTSEVIVASHYKFFTKFIRSVTVIKRTILYVAELPKLPRIAVPI